MSEYNVVITQVRGSTRTVKATIMPQGGWYDTETGRGFISETEAIALLLKGTTTCADSLGDPRVVMTVVR